MEINKLRKEITQLIDNIKEHSDYLTDFERIPHVELEMILVKIKKLHERAIIFTHEYEQQMLAGKAKNQTQPSQPSSAQAVNEIKASMPAEKPVEEKEAIDLPKEKFPEDEPGKKMPEAPKENLVEDEPEKKLVQEHPGAHIEEISGGKRNELSKAELNERLKESVKSGSLNETIGSGKLIANLSNKLQMNPIGDLTKAIGLNEKFSFTKELFRNDSAAFAEAISKLNNFNNFAEADHYLQDELAQKYQWKNDSEQVMKLRELLQRRYL
jgi:hypothetical protein